MLISKKQLQTISYKIPTGLGHPYAIRHNVMFLSMLSPVNRVENVECERRRQNERAVPKTTAQHDQINLNARSRAKSTLQNRVSASIPFT